MDDTTPATKADISMIMEKMEKMYAKINQSHVSMKSWQEKMDENMALWKQAWDTMLVEWRVEIHTEFAQWKLKFTKDIDSKMQRHTDEIKQHFDVVAENIQYDMVGAHKDKISVIDDRSLRNRSRIEGIEKVLAM